MSETDSQNETNIKRCGLPPDVCLEGVFPGSGRDGRQQQLPPCVPILSLSLSRFFFFVLYPTETRAAKLNLLLLNNTAE